MTASRISIGVGVALVGVCAVLGLAPLALGAWVRLAVVTSLVLGAACAALVLRGTGHPPFVTLVVLGVLARVLLFPADHILSDDAFRYHFDGKTIAHLRNPFLHAPSDPAVDDLHTDAIDARINHPDVVTVYPPTAQLAFAIGYLLSPGRLFGFHLVTLAAELVGWLVLARVVAIRRRRARAPDDADPDRGARGLLLPVLLPLAVFQAYLPGHTEPLALPWIALALLGAERRWSARTGIALGLAAMVKPAPLLLLPAFLREFPARRWPALLGALAATVLIGYLPFVGAGENLWSSMLLMARAWWFNGVVAAGLGVVLPDAALRPVLAGLVLAFTALAAWRGADLPARALGALLALLVFSPTVYPWYVLWLVPFLVLRPDPTAITLAVLVPLADLVAIRYYGEGVWDPAPWRSTVTWGGTLVVLGISAWRRWGVFAPATAPGSR